MSTPASFELQSRSTSINRFRNIFFFVLILFFLGAVAFPTHAGACTKTATTGVLPPGDPKNICDLEVTTGQVIVDSTSMPAAWGNVNIWGGGSLCFIDQGKNLDFWATNILVENDGALTNGIDDPNNNNVRCILGGFGSQGGTLTIHLYGPAQGVGTGKGDGGVGITCKADNKNQCGVPDDIWNSNKMDMEHMNPASCNISELPGLYGHIKDCFYQYAPLDFDDGKNASGNVGYFGYKVLAVAYGGRLKLYGSKGVSPMGNNAPCNPGTACPQQADSGRSWGRLIGTVTPTATTLVLDRQVFWQPGDQIVLTTTDYIPGHSEQLQLKTVTRNASTTTLVLQNPIQYDHNGVTYDLSSVPAGIGPDPDPNVKCTTGQTRCIETRAAIGLLTRSIRIVSGCDNYGQEFPAPGKNCDGTDNTDGNSYYFGGQVIARQGLDLFQLSGVEIKNLGEGGRIMHYPVHFHMARTVPFFTFVDDSSIWDSMNRWVTIHATKEFELARNVGYLSIGHGFYLEDGSETGNFLTANLGVMVRGGIANAQNPRKIPGIFAAGRRYDTAADEVPEHSDVEHPTTFWITNGYNYFSYNMAAGANTCGMCYWLVPATNSGMSRYQHWEHYAALQEFSHVPSNGLDDLTYAGTTPLAYFVGNSCVSAQSSFLTIGSSAACKAISQSKVDTPAIVNPLAPDYPQENTKPYTDYPQADMYYPKIPSGGSRQATICTFSDTGSSCSTGHLKDAPPVNPCAYNGSTRLAESDCTITQLDRYTTSFNWADTNVSAVWLRKQWNLFSNGAVTDVQNGGLTFVSGGGYSYSDEIPGYWALAHKSVFVGNTQLLKEITIEGQKVGMPDNPFASNAGPFNPMTHASLPCQADTPNDTLCMSPEEGVYFATTNFANNQRLFNIYDGPSYQSFNAYMDVTTTVLAGCTPGQGQSGAEECRDKHYWGNGVSIGVPQDSTAGSGGKCYLPNAAIAWKQPNGFYYPPAFRSNNLYFNFDSDNRYRRVDIRHFVIEPLFKETTLDTDKDLVDARYCTVLDPAHKGDQEIPTQFRNWTDIDRQTELTDEDGSVTGLQGPTINKFRMPTISVNKDPFFNAPIETTECSSDIFANMPNVPLGGSCAFGNDQLCGTANTTPYDYVTTAIFPPESSIGDTWAKDCTTQMCPGVPLYRLDGVKGDGSVAPLIRMAGQSVGQRSNLTVNHGSYYLDTTQSLQTQTDWGNRYGGAETTFKTVFLADHEYYVFLLYARPDLKSTPVGPPPTVQDYYLYVGTGFTLDSDHLFGIRVDQGQTQPGPTHVKVDFPDGWTKEMVGDDVLHVQMKMSAIDGFATEWKKARKDHCAPVSYCTWKGSDDTGSCQCAHSGDAECTVACSWAGRDISCPESSGDPNNFTGGCYGFGFKLPTSFQAADQVSKNPPKATCVNKDGNWNTPFDNNFSNPNKAECDYSGKTIPDNFCSSGKRTIGARTGGLSQ